jgi:hypothetical protein
LQANDANASERSSGTNPAFARRLRPMVQFISLSDELLP